MDENNYQTYNLAPNFLLNSDNSPVKFELSDVEQFLIDQIWENDKRDHEGLLFNGKLLVFKSFQEGRLTGSFIDYKYYRAQSSLPKLKKTLNINPIAISCSCIYKDEILIGRRSKAMTGFPGFFELVPSGGISMDSSADGVIDLKKQSLIELEEEAGISAQFVKSCIPVALINEISTSIYEIYMEIKLQDRDEQNKERIYNTQEYSMLQWMPISDLFSFVEKEKKSFVPLSLYLIDHFLKK